MAIEGLFAYRPLSPSTQLDALFLTFQKAFKKHGVKITKIPSNKVVQTIQGQPKKYQWVLLWDPDVAIAKFLEMDLKVPVFNNHRTLNAMTDRGLTFLAMRNFSVPTPSTIILPYTFNVNVLTSYSEVLDMVKPLGYPFLIKERFDVIDDKVYLITDEQKLSRLFMEVGMKALMAQQYIEPTQRHIVQGLVIGGKLFAGIERFDTAEGEIYRPYAIEGLLKDIILRAAQAVEADFCAVDVIIDAKKRPLVFSVKPNPDIVKLQSTTGIYLSWYIARYVLQMYNRFRKGMNT
jgi:glutathione synthase/RimK-type ligase-like ATP-grasp enzyme